MTERERLLQCIYDHHARYNYGPSYRQLGEAIGASGSHARRCVLALAGTGLVGVARGQRNVWLTEAGIAAIREGEE